MDAAIADLWLAKLDAFAATLQQNERDELFLVISRCALDRVALQAPHVDRVSAELQTAAPLATISAVVGQNTALLMACASAQILGEMFQASMTAQEAAQNLMNECRDGGALLPAKNPGHQIYQAQYALECMEEHLLEGVDMVRKCLAANWSTAKGGES